MTSLGKTVSGYNVFEIPVNENANTSIQALTQAMSGAHLIDYTIYVAQAGQAGTAGAAESTVGSNTKTLDETAPEIFGLTAQNDDDEDTEDFYADHFRIFRYEGGYRLIEIELAEDTALDGTDTMENDAQADNMTSRRLYKQDVIKYLVVPEGSEVPVGLENDVILIQQPISSAAVFSSDALDMFTALEADDVITALGIEEKDVKADEIKDRMAEDYKGSDAIKSAGTFDGWDLKAIAKTKCNLLVQTSSMLPQEEKDIEDFTTLYDKEVDNVDTLQIPMLIDRSGDEVNDLAKAEWIKVYGVLLGEEEKADAIYQKALSAAGSQEKEEALAAKN